MRQLHSLFLPIFSSSNNCDGPFYEGCSFTQTYRPSPSTTTTFTSCTFTRLISDDNGGAVYFTSGDSHSVNDCTFTGCSSSISFNDYNGGGGVFSSSGTLSVSTTVFISCSAQSLGGAIFGTAGCSSIVVAESTFLCCSCENSGGAVCLHLGPTGEVSSSCFLLSSLLSSS